MKPLSFFRVAKGAVGVDEAISTSEDHVNMMAQVFEELGLPEPPKPLDGNGGAQTSFEIGFPQHATIAGPMSSFEEVAAKAASVRSLLGELGVKMHRDSQLATLLRSAIRISDQFAKGEAKRSMDEIVAMALADRVASAILDVGNDPGAMECLRRMTSNSIDLNARGASPAKDSFWEIELASSLKRRGIEVSFSEPDLVAKVSGVDYPIACKKVNSEKGVEGSVRKGAKQLQRFGRTGIIALSIDELTPEQSVLVSGDRKSAGDMLGALNKAFIERNQPHLQEFIANGRCDAFLVNTNVVVNLTEAKSGWNNYSQTTFWTLNPPYGPKDPAIYRLADAVVRTA